MRSASLTPRSYVWGRRASELVYEFEADELAHLLSPRAAITELQVRPAMGSDLLRIETLRRANREWLAPWEATIPPDSPESVGTWVQYSRRMNKLMRQGRGLVAAVQANREVVGNVSLGCVETGALSQAMLGYWIARDFAGQGITSLAVASVVDMAIERLGLHRIEVNVRPENAPSLAVCRRLRLRQEGYKPRYMHIGGAWADHVAFAVDAKDLEHASMVERLYESRRNNPQS